MSFLYSVGDIWSLPIKFKIIQTIFLNIIFFITAVMNALQNLQDKIGTLEVGREKAETNLKRMVVDSSEYKELLKQKHDQSSSSIGSHCSLRRDSHSEG